MDLEFSIHSDLSAKVEEVIESKRRVLPIRNGLHFDVSDDWEVKNCELYFACLERLWRGVTPSAFAFTLKSYVDVHVVEGLVTVESGCLPDIHFTYHRGSLGNYPDILDLIDLNHAQGVFPLQPSTSSHRIYSAEKTQVTWQEQFFRPSRAEEIMLDRYLEFWESIKQRSKTVLPDAGFSLEEFYNLFYVKPQDMESPESCK